MSNLKDGGLAFPVGSGDMRNPPGISIRDYFAAKAMQAICSQPDAPDWTVEGIAKAAYQQADAMLKERQK